MTTNSVKCCYSGYQLSFSNHETEPLGKGCFTCPDKSCLHNPVDVLAELTERIKHNAKTKTLEAKTRA